MYSTPLATSAACAACCRAKNTSQVLWYPAFGVLYKSGVAVCQACLEQYKDMKQREIELGGLRILDLELFMPEYDLAIDSAKSAIELAKAKLDEILSDTNANKERIRQKNKYLCAVNDVKCTKRGKMRYAKRQLQRANGEVVDRFTRDADAPDKDPGDGYDFDSVIARAEKIVEQELQDYQALWAPLVHAEEEYGRALGALPILKADCDLRYEGTRIAQWINDERRPRPRPDNLYDGTFEYIGIAELSAVFNFPHYTQAVATQNLPSFNMRKRCSVSTCWRPLDHCPPGETTGTHCAVHRPDDYVPARDIAILKKNPQLCELDGCPKPASYGERGGRATRCRDHCSPGSVCVRSPKSAGPSGSAEPFGPSEPDALAREVNSIMFTLSMTNDMLQHIATGHSTVDDAVAQFDVLLLSHYDKTYHRMLIPPIYNEEMDVRHGIRIMMLAFRLFGIEQVERLQVGRSPVELLKLLKAEIERVRGVPALEKPWPQALVIPWDLSIDTARMPEPVGTQMLCAPLQELGLE